MVLSGRAAQYTVNGKLIADAEELICPADLDAGIARLAADVNERFADQELLVLCVLNGGIVVTGQLLPKLDLKVRLDYLHCSRYVGTSGSSELSWHARPVSSLEGRTVLIVDDIIDRGRTLEAVLEYCREQGAADVSSLVLLSKQTDRAVSILPDFVGFEVPDRYVFGFGMDYHGYLRNLGGIFAFPD